jgi:hypothetical protein
MRALGRRQVGLQERGEAAVPVGTRKPRGDAVSVVLVACTAQCQRSWRFIPACAGNAVWSRAGHPHPPVHPCVCGAPSTGTIRLWDVTNGAETARLEATRNLPSLSPLPDGLLTSACSDNTIRLWDVPGRCEVTRFEIDVYVLGINIRAVTGGAASIVMRNRTGLLSGPGPRTKCRSRAWNLYTILPSF